MFNESLNQNLTNNSGQGKNSPVVSIVSDRFNWGAFFFGWFWGIFNRSLITLIEIPACFVPFIGGILVLALSIWFGVEGNKWAWQNKKWQNIEHFHVVQKKWAIAGVILCVFTVVLTILITAAVTIPALLSSTEDVHLRTQKMKQVSMIQSTMNINKVLEKECSVLDSTELSEYFISGMRVEENDDGLVTLSDGTVMEFYGDGFCENEGDCYINIDLNGDKAPNEDGCDIINLPIYLKDGKYPFIRAEILEEYLSTSYSDTEE